MIYLHNENLRYDTPKQSESALLASDQGNIKDPGCKTFRGYFIPPIKLCAWNSFANPGRLIQMSNIFIFNLKLVGFKSVLFLVGVPASDVSELRTNKKY